MSENATIAGYSKTAKSLHWLIVALGAVPLNFVLSVGTCPAA
jgi:hypothetical protein